MSEERSLFRQQGHLIRSALAYFTRFRVGQAHADLAQAGRYLPLVGLLIGTITALVFLAAHALWGPGIAAILALITPVWLTGAFHEDGFADTCDGYGGGWQRAQILAIQKDSRVGAFALVGSILQLALRGACIAQLPLDYAVGALISMHTCARFAALLMMWQLPYARSDESKAAPVARGFSRADLWPALLTTLVAIGLIAWQGGTLALLAAVLMSLGGWIYLNRLFSRWTQGVTGDGLGATEQVTQTLWLLGLLGVWNTIL